MDQSALPEAEAQMGRSGWYDPDDEQRMERALDSDKVPSAKAEAVVQVAHRHLGPT